MLERVMDKQFYMLKVLVAVGLLIFRQMINVSRILYIQVVEACLDIFVLALMNGINKGKLKIHGFLGKIRFHT
jgi:hypothetical protein